LREPIKIVLEKILRGQHLLPIENNAKEYGKPPWGTITDENQHLWID